jgi:hypothetical protein
MVVLYMAAREWRGNIDFTAWLGSTYNRQHFTFQLTGFHP